MKKKDFGNLDIYFLRFVPAVKGKDAEGLRIAKSSVDIDGWFTIAQLRNIADELERQEQQMRLDNGKKE